MASKPLCPRGLNISAVDHKSDALTTTLASQVAISMVCVSVVVLEASQVTVVSSIQSPSNSYHYYQQPEPRQLMTPTKSDRHVDELRRQHGVVKPFKSPRRKWFVS